MKEINNFIVEKLKINKDSKISNLKQFSDLSEIYFTANLNYDNKIEPTFYYVYKSNTRYKYCNLMTVKYIDSDGKIYDKVPEGKNFNEFYLYPNEIKENTQIKLKSWTHQTQGKYVWTTKQDFINEHYNITIKWNGNPIYCHNKYQGVWVMMTNEMKDKLNLNI